MRKRKHPIVEAEITGMAFGGKGIARIDGMAVDYFKKLAGELGDGWITTLSDPARMRNDSVHLRRGAERAGRSLANFQAAVRLAQSGKLGKIHTLVASVYAPTIETTWLPGEPTPPALADAAPDQTARRRVFWDGSARLPSRRNRTGPGPGRPREALSAMHDPNDAIERFLGSPAHFAQLCAKVT